MAVAIWTYSGDPANSDEDAVRFLIGDTDSERKLVDDREITWSISKAGNFFMSAALVCESLASKYAREADCSMGGMSSSLSKVADAWSKRADDLRAMATKNCTPFFGGLTISGKKALDDRTDDVQPSMRTGMFDNPEAPSDRWSYADRRLGE